MSLTGGKPSSSSEFMTGISCPHSGVKWASLIVLGCAALWCLDTLFLSGQKQVQPLHMVVLSPLISSSKVGERPLRSTCCLRRPQIGPYSLRSVSATAP